MANRKPGESTGETDGPRRPDSRPDAARSPLADHSGSIPLPHRQSYEELRQEYLRLRHVAFNERTGVPTHSAILGELRASLASGSSMAVFLISIENLSALETSLGWQVADSLLMSVTEQVKLLLPQLLDDTARLAQDGVAGEDLLIFLPLGGNSVGRDLDVLESVSERLSAALSSGLRSDESVANVDVDVATGYSVFVDCPSMRLERAVSRAIAEAKAMLRHEQETSRLKQKMQLRQIIADRHLRVAYQPIIDLQRAEIMGQEALCRGPIGTPFAMAEFLFSSSLEHDLAFELDQTCREAVLAVQRPLREEMKLFLNVLPDSIMDGRMDHAELVDRVHAGGFQPSEVVLEIAERGRITSYEAFRKRLAPFREDGFQLAVDDVGAGYSSLRVIPEVAPDYLKVDAELVKGIDTHPTKAGVLGTIVDMAARLGSAVICEGIEREEELRTVIEHGADLGQGYYLVEPCSDVVEDFEAPAGFGP